MSLIKKTIVLASDKPQGYVTVIRLGSETGAKIVGESFTENMFAYLKMGEKFEQFPLTGKKTERELSISLEQNDELSCVIYNEKIVAVGGRSLSKKETERLLLSYLEALSPKEPEVVSVSAVEPTKNDENTAPNTLVEDNNNAQENDNVESETEPQEEKLAENEIAEEENREENEEKKEEKEEKKENEEKEEQNFSVKTEVSEEKNEFLQRLVGKETNFYIGISDKVDEMFIVYPEEKELSKIIPDSEWVKINYDGEDYYVIGRLRDEGKVKYLGYGVPGREDVKPPKVAEGIASWIPTKGENGYWVFFQSASTGEIS